MSKPKKRPRTFLPDQIQAEIREKYLAGANRSDLEAEYGVSPSYIHTILHRGGITRTTRIVVDPATTFRDIEGFPGYRVGDDGSIWSCRFHGRQTEHWRPMTPSYDRDGYPRIYLWKDGKAVVRKVHRLVLEAFVGPAPDGCQCCHEDDNPRNNRLGNLRWDTTKGNVSDQFRNGRRRRATIVIRPESERARSKVAGSRNRRSKLTETDIPVIRSMYSEGYDQRQIASRFGVSQYAIWCILAGKTWSHAP